MAKKKQKKKFIKRYIPQIKIAVSSGDSIDYKNVKLLTKFLSPRFKILPRQRTGISAKVQRKVVLEIKKARIMGLLAFTERQQV